jgi:peptidyl-tRNA hydrolase
LLERMQAMTSSVTPPPEEAPPAEYTYLLNPSAEMTSGKALAQIAHAAVIAADSGENEEWVAAGCPAAVARPPAEAFKALCGRDDLVAKVEDAGLTEVAPGTVTVLMTRSRGSRT